MDLYLNVDKPRKKSIARVDGDAKKRKPSREEQLAEALGVENFLGDLTSKTVVRKSEELSPTQVFGDMETILYKSCSPALVEHLAEKVHNAWRELAPEGHRNQVPYNELTEAQKDKDRQTVEAVLHALDAMHLFSDEEGKIQAALSKKFIADEHIGKADNSHLPKGAERCAYTPNTNYGIVYIPVNRLRQVYQTDEALNPAKVNENRRKMREGIPLSPVEIGYNYDVHDGHHRWEAAKKEGHTHVPCKVVGTDPEKVKEARQKYMDVWKSLAIDLKEGLYVDLGKSMGHLDFSKLVKKAVQVRGKDGKIFTRMQWVAPNEISTGHGVRKIASLNDMQDAIKHGIKDHPQFWDALHEQGLNPNTMAQHDPKHHPHFYLPETEESADNGRFSSNHIAHGRRVMGHKVYEGDELLHKQDQVQEHKNRKMAEAHASKDIWSDNHTPKHIDGQKLRSGTSLVSQFQSKIDDFVEKQSMGDPDWEEKHAGGNAYKHLHDLLKGTTVEGLEHVFSHPDGVFTAKLAQFDPNFDSDFQSLGARAQMNLYHQDGSWMGQIDRIVMNNTNADMNHQGTLVNNKLFEIDKRHQGTNVAGHMYERSEDYWKHLANGGDVHIFMTANISVGTYAWAKKGFDFYDEIDAHMKREELIGFLKAHNLDIGSTVKDSGFDHISDIKTAQDFAELDCGKAFDPSTVAKTPMPNDNDRSKPNRVEKLEEIRDEPMHLGKAFMLFGASSWDGYKKL